MLAPSHVPVMVEETLKALNVQPGGRYIDCTVGGGGHAAAILDHALPGGQLLGMDADPKAIEAARAILEPYDDSVLLVNDNFVNLELVCYHYDFQPVHGILFDLGLSSLQLESDRGFSFQRDYPLDMRFDPKQELTAADIINNYSELELAQILRDYGEEIFSRRIARQIVQERPINSTAHLAKLIEKTVGRRGRIHPATRTFQALRIVVNHELDNLKSALSQSVELLGFEGRLVVISYHSLEDRIVKQFMRQESQDCICPPGTPACLCGHKARLSLVNKRIIVPSPEEIERNPRSRSAKLRVAERIISPEEHSGIVERLCAATQVKVNAWRQPTLLKRVRRVFQTAWFGGRGKRGADEVTTGIVAGSQN